MKKMLTMGVIALFASSAFAGGVKITDQDDIATSTTNDANMNVILDVESNFVFKMLNDKATAVGGTPAEGLDTLLDLGDITAGVAAAGLSGACSDLVGLTDPAQMGVSATADADTLLTPAADAASCAVVHGAGGDAGNIDLRLAIPMVSLLSKSGAGQLNLTLAKRSEAPSAQDFQQFDLCRGTVGGDAPVINDAAVPAACVTAEAGQAAIPHGYNNSMYLLVDARLAGVGALSHYSQYIDVDLTPVP